MKVYLVAGRAGSGKAEVAKIIEDYYNGLGKKTVITEFSKYLKMYAKDIIGYQENDPKPRKFLQDLGVTIKDNMDMPKMLINRLIEDLKIYELYFDVVVISDVRYPEEIEEIKNLYPESYSMYIVNQFQASSLSLEEQMHITETALENYNNFDITITNDNLNVLDNRVISFIESSENSEH